MSLKAGRQVAAEPETKRSTSRRRKRRNIRQITGRLQRICSWWPQSGGTTHNLQKQLLQRAAQTSRLQLQKRKQTQKKDPPKEKKKQLEEGAPAAPAPRVILSVAARSRVLNAALLSSSSSFGGRRPFLSAGRSRAFVLGTGVSSLALSGRSACSSPHLHLKEAVLIRLPTLLLKPLLHLIFCVMGHIMSYLETFHRKRLQPPRKGLPLPQDIDLPCKGAVGPPF